jgi:transcriptional regulatory protein GAL4
MEVAGSSQRRRSTVHRRACAECQKRKTRCMGSRDDLQTCSYCRKAGKRCTFEALPSRTSLTRKNLDEAERRNRQLESLLRSLRPDLDIDSAVQNIADTSIDSDADENQPQNKQPSPRSSDEFEWHETALSEGPGPSKDGAGMGDGMANLPANSQEAGYLGMNASNIVS